MIEKYDNIIGRSPVMQSVYESINIVAKNSVTVLILGETGTGKELVARAIHDHSSRKYESYMKIDCIALPETLLESELFGYKKGAFTDARFNKPGKLEIADGGTVFLDEIGDIPLTIQAKLLRFLEEQAFEPLGSTITIRVNVRIIAATNRDLTDIIESGKFRQDLFYRLNVFPINILPLRKRIDDIPLLSSYFLNLFQAHYERSSMKFSNEVISAFNEYHWPGNVRQLKHVVEYAVLRCRQEKIKIEHLPDDFLHEFHDEIIDQKRITLAEYTSRLIEQILKKHHGNRRKTCEELRISRTTLWRWIKQHNISNIIDS